jgi:hypothetical protein
MCRPCQRKLSELREFKVYVGDDHIQVTGLKLHQAVELALARGIPPDAEFAVYQEYGDYHAVLQWPVTE